LTTPAAGSMSPEAADAIVAAIPAGRVARIEHVDGAVLVTLTPP